MTDKRTNTDYDYIIMQDEDDLSFLKLSKVLLKVPNGIEVPEYGHVISYVVDNKKMGYAINSEVKSDKEAEQLKKEYQLDKLEYYTNVSEWLEILGKVYGIIEIPTITIVR